MTDVRHVGAQLVSTPGHRLERDERELLARGLDHRVIGDRVARTFLAVARDAHDGFILALVLGEKGRDAALLRLGDARHRRPVDLARGAGAKGFRQRGGGEAGLRHQQAARGVAVEPMHKARALALLVPQTVQHAVDMLDHAGAALHRKPDRLVEHQHVGVLVERNRLEECARLRILFRTRRWFCLEPQRRDAHRLPGAQAILAVDALTVDAQLAFADDALDVGERETRKLRLQEPVDPHAGLVRRDRHCLDAGCDRRWRRGLGTLMRGACGRPRRSIGAAPLASLCSGSGLRSRFRSIAIGSARSGAWLTLSHEAHA